VPSAPAGSYEVNVIYIPYVKGPGSDTPSNPADFAITYFGASDVATIYPNPFNAGTEVVNIAVTSTGGANNIGFYIFDMTAKLVNRQVVSAPTSATTWNGYDQTNTLVGDGAYIVRVINEDTKSVIAKGKLLVVKR